jgi:hypothetical protein
MVQLSATKCSCITILWVGLVSFAAIALCVASQRVLIVFSLSNQSGNFWIHSHTNDSHGVSSIFYNKLVPVLKHRTMETHVELEVKFRGIVQCYSAGLQAGGPGIWVPAGAGNFSFHHRVQTGSEAHPAPYAMRTTDFFPWLKAAGTWSLHLVPR